MAKWKRVTIAELAADVAGRANSERKSDETPTLMERATCLSSDQMEQHVAESCLECTNLKWPCGELTELATFQN